MVDVRTKMIIQQQRVQNILVQGMKNQVAGTSDCSHEYILIVNKLRSYLEPLARLHRAKLNANDFQENLFGPPMASETFFNSISSTH